MNKNSLFKASTGCVPFSLLQLLLLFWVAIGSAQSVPITGTVMDSQGALLGVNVQIKNKTVGTVTDGEGKFKISASPEDVLVFSFIGYVLQAVQVGTQTGFNISLKPDETALQEVLVNAGYYKVKDKERTGSITKITAKDIETQPVSNVLATMQGRMAGVSITQTTGVPGGSFEIQIRGQNSIRSGGNNPMYVIDGVPYASDPIGSGQNSAVLPGRPSPLNSINPDQIESIEVLKDADATAIYGSRGANGVVLITTKKGRAGKTSFSTTVSQGAGRVTRFMDLLSSEQYLAMRNEAFINDGVSPLPDTAYDVNGTWDTSRSKDWQKELLGGTATFTDVQAAVNGGSEQTQFLLSSNFNQQTTVFPGDFNYRKINVHASMSHASADQRFSTLFSAGYTYQNNLQPLVDLTSTALTLAPTAPELYTTDGSINWEESTFNNPIAGLKGEYESKVYDLIANGSLSYQILPSLTVKSSFGYTALNNDEITAAPSTIYDPAYGVGPEFSTLIAGKADRKSWIAEPQVQWTKGFGKLTLDALTGATFQWQQGSQLVQFAEGFANNSLIHNIASASSVSIFSSETTEYKYQAFFGRLNLNWNEKYILNLTGRRDGSSRFGPGKKFANFGAVGAAWLFSREHFLKDSKAFSFGKLRMSYGVTGSDQIGDYQYLDTYGSSGVNYNGVIGLQPTRLYNPYFGWESNRKFEVAIETGFLNDRIFFTAGWYRNKSSNQLVGIPLPGTTGFTSIQSNLNAVVENKGSEFTLRTVNIRRKNFSWTTHINLTFTKNKLVEYPNLATSTYKNTLVIGEPLNIKKVYHFTGVDPLTGLYTFADVNNDGKLTGAEDRTQIMDLNPEYYGGLQNQLQYKNVQLDFLFQFVKQLNYNEIALFGTPGTMSNQPVSVLNHWQQEGDRAPRQLFTDGSNSDAMDAHDKYMNSDAAISDASFIRLKNVSLSYNIPQTLTGPVRCRLFLQAQNLLTLTNFRGADPEFKAVGYLPPLRTISAGAQFTF